MDTVTKGQHTPGPWRNDPADGALVIAGVDPIVALAEVFHVRDEQEANARLIAAAPALYAALLRPDQAKANMARADRDRERVKALTRVLRHLIDCHNDRCDGKPGAPCPHPVHARALLARIDKGE